jgi:cytochrome c-type biogenesis protein CcsB
MIKKILIASYIIIILCMAAATIIEKTNSASVSTYNIYGSWWFCSLWCLLTLVSIIYIIQMKMKRPTLIILHLSLVIILIGALVTHLTSHQGMMYLRKGEKTNIYFVQDKESGIKEKTLPFFIELNSFEIKYHDGTMAASDFTSSFIIDDGKKEVNGSVSMNKIFSYHNVRLYQSSYDDDGNTSILSLNSDPIGIPITYTGYAILFISLILLLINPHGEYRKILRKAMATKGFIIILILILSPTKMNGAETLPKDIAEKFGEINILYNNRISPLETFAINFTKKIYGEKSFNGLTAEQVIMGWIFAGEQWSDEPFIKIKRGELKTRLKLPDFATFNSFFQGGYYILGPYLQEYYQGDNDSFHKQVIAIDDKLQLILSLRRGTTLKIFPFTNKGITTWYSPVDNYPAGIDKLHKMFMSDVFSLLNKCIDEQDYSSTKAIICKIWKYQIRNGGKSLPSEVRIKAEHAYNNISFVSILFKLNLSMGILTLILIMLRITTFDNKYKRTIIYINRIFFTIMILSFVLLTTCETLRWIISGTMPISNGYETMMFIAWLVMLLSIIMYRHFHILIIFGFLLSGLFLLVSQISQMDPQITNLMPVLSSPLLSIHVSIIMISFALLSLTFICGLMAIEIDTISSISNKLKNEKVSDYIKRLQLLSQIFLYPAISTLGIGIFIGAIWANISWGQYWSWDSKETWALITFMVYIISIHQKTFKSFQRPMFFHIYITLAFITIIITYFGVNYILCGMHSYA